jgi:hypothetical protein
MKTPILSTNYVHRWLGRSALLSVSLLIGCFGLLPNARAVTPPPDGGYANGNTAEGTNALFRLTNGINNTAVGFDALFDNTTGSLNIANGYQALYSNTTGSDNTANGFQALYGNTTGSDNTANGFRALSNVTIGSQNTGSQNTANGGYALYFNTTGHQNTAAGYGAHFFNTTGSSNIALGFSAGDFNTTGNSNIDIGNEGGNESNTIRIGSFQTRTFIAGISGVAVSGAAVVVNASGQLGVAASSSRFKDKITAMDKASETILGLKPVTFRYKPELDPKRVPQFGLVAEEVDKVNPDLVIRDADGQPYTVRYDAVNAMLLNEFLKEHRTVQDLKATVAKQEAAIATLTSSLKQQASQIQRVSTEVALSKTASQTIVNNQ